MLPTLQKLLLPTIDQKLFWSYLFSLSIQLTQSTRDWLKKPNWIQSSFFLIRFDFCWMSTCPGAKVRNFWFFQHIWRCYECVYAISWTQNSRSFSRSRESLLASCGWATSTGNDLRRVQLENRFSILQKTYRNRHRNFSKSPVKSQFVIHLARKGEFSPEIHGEYHCRNRRKFLST